MSNEFTVQPVAAMRASSDTAGDARSALPQPAPLPDNPAQPDPIPNPSLRLDPALGLVVIEFRNDTSGAITTSIPTERQLQAYQRWDVTHFGPTPSGLRKAAATAASPPEPAVQPKPRAPPPAKPVAVKVPQTSRPRET